VIVLIVFFRVRTMSRERKLDLKSLWAVPIVYVILIGFMFFALPPPITGWELLLAGLIVGLLAGWYRGRLIHIHQDAETGELRQKASPLAMILLLAIIVLKVGARQVLRRWTRTARRR
jgi:amino acid transporter